LFPFLDEGTTLSGVPDVCVIDDDYSLRKALVGLITSMGFQCRGHGSAEAALECGDAERAGCVLTDIHMPGLDGFALKKRLDGLGRGDRVIMMTGRDDVLLEQRARDAGALCFLRKPLRAEALADCIAQAIGEG
jgi:FixJ family two-component response regulator